MPNLMPRLVSCPVCAPVCMPGLMPSLTWEEREGEGRIAVPAYKDSLAEALKKVPELGEPAK
eukprot:1141694-Pelagomonas_calceolata.AAC.5